MKLRTPHLSMVAVLATLVVAGCGVSEEELEAVQSLDSLNVIDEHNLNALMLNFADPNQAVAYFQRSLSEEPDRAEFQRGLALSLSRADRPAEAVLAFKNLKEKGNAQPNDQLKYAESHIQLGEWKKAEVELDVVPPTIETYDRFRLEAMIADNNREWTRADSYYEQAREKTTRPAHILNNWGISKLARGDRTSAEELFTRSISYDRKLFSAKNNLAISRATRRVYELPLVPLTTVESAELLHNIALQAIRNGDVDIGRGLLEQAIERHPQFFADAVNKLEALNQNVLR